MPYKDLELRRKYNREYQRKWKEANPHKKYKPHRLYSVWKNMRNRCYRTYNKDYSNYGGRGIAVYDRWLNSFKNFLEDMGPSWEEGLTLDRIDNDGDYGPGNCRWATHKEQVRNNKGKNHYSSKLTEDDVLFIRRSYERGKYTRQELAEQHGVSWTTIDKIVKRIIWKDVK